MRLCSRDEYIVLECEVPGPIALKLFAAIVRKGGGIRLFWELLICAFPSSEKVFDHRQKKEADRPDGHGQQTDEKPLESVAGIGIV